MRITTKGTNFTFTPDIVSYLTRKLEKVATLIGDDATAIADVEIAYDILHTQGRVYKAEITVTCAGAQYRAEATQSSPTAAIDVVEEEIVKEIRRSKGKRMRFTRLEGLRFKNLLRGWPFRRGS